eukprot:GEMP01028420.1.p1 GENE.GEMP01028420.1~~GEMP01028420.1.p1  ORF type:complete len:299 (+),score=95.84 GEMP01028420.1:115-1011(+)
MVSCVVKCLNGDVLTFPQCDMVVDVKAKVAKRMGTLYMYVWLLADDDTVTLVHEDNALPPPCVYAVVNEPHYWHNPQYEDAAHDRDTHPYPDILRKLTRYWDNGATLTHLARLKAIRVHAREGDVHGIMRACCDGAVEIYDDGRMDDGVSLEFVVDEPNARQLLGQAVVHELYDCARLVRGDEGSATDETIFFLLRLRADANVMEPIYGSGALMGAVQRGCGGDVVDALIAARAAVDVVDKYGERPLAVARWKGRYDIAHSLESALRCRSEAADAVNRNRQTSKARKPRKRPHLHKTA